MCFLCDCDCVRGDSESAEAANKSRQIDRELQTARAKINRENRVLLLGTGESGKTTFLKQMILIHVPGKFTADQLAEYKQQIYWNVLDGMQKLLHAKKMLRLRWRNDEGRELEIKADRVRRFDKVRRDFELNSETFAEITPFIADLWKEDILKQAYNRRGQFQISDSCQYFFDKIEALAEPDYTPSDRDVLYCRKATKNIQDHDVMVRNVLFRFIDVGGQRSQRHKWFMMFDDCIQSILFFVATSEYDQFTRTRSGNRVNKIQESLDVFEVVANDASFRHRDIILFLNKTDLLEEKLPNVSFKKFFPSFAGNERCLEDVQAFIKRKFTDIERSNSEQLIYFYNTIAVDTQNITKIFKSVKDQILIDNLKKFHRK